jgi:hypothetical protein
MDFFLSSTIKRTAGSMHRYKYGDKSVENVDSQEGDNEKGQDLSGSLIHGMRPSNDDGLQDV